MAITALATTNTTIGPAQYADMAQALAPRFLVDSPTDLNPSYSSGVLSITTGAALIAGTRIRVSGTNSVNIPSIASGTTMYTVVIRVDWSKGATDAATLVALPTTTINRTSSPNASKINRIPGVLYDAVICTVTRYGGSTAHWLQDYRMWGGDGGPIRVTQAALDAPGMLDARVGTMITTERGEFTKRLDNDWVWRDVGTASNPWRLWTPTPRYYGDKAVDGKTGGTPAQLGSGAVCAGRYRVVDGMLDGYLNIIPGATTQFGTGAITLDLPLPCANWLEDTWSMGHIYTVQGDGFYDWHAEMLVKSGWTRGMLWTNPIQSISRLEPHRSADASGQAGTGIPFIAGGWSEGKVYSFHVNYPVA